MNYQKKFRIDSGSHVQLDAFDPQFVAKHAKKKSAHKQIKKLQSRMDELQFRLYAEQKHSLLICLQALDAGGKDGVSGMSWAR